MEEWDAFLDVSSWNFVDSLRRFWGYSFSLQVKALQKIVEICDKPLRLTLTLHNAIEGWLSIAFLFFVPGVTKFQINYVLGKICLDNYSSYWRNWRKVKVEWQCKHSLFCYCYVWQRGERAFEKGRVISCQTIILLQHPPFHRLIENASVTVNTLSSISLRCRACKWSLHSLPDLLRGDSKCSRPHSSN